MNRFMIIFVMVATFLTVGCKWNDGPSQEEFDQLQSSLNEAIRAREAEAVTPPTEEEVAAEVIAEAARVEATRVADSLTAWNEANPCPPVFKADSLTGFMTPKEVRDFISGHACDPYQEYFDSLGRLDASQAGDRMSLRLVSMHGRRGSGQARIMATIARILWPLKNAYNLVPKSAQQDIFSRAMGMIAPAIVGLGTEEDPGAVHLEEVNRYLLDLDWSRDIQSVNPDWWTSVEWPANDTTRVTLPGYGDIGFADLWARMFWKRRGPEIFGMAKAAFATAKAAR